MLWLFDLLLITEWQLWSHVFKAHGKIVCSDRSRPPITRCFCVCGLRAFKVKIFAETLYTTVQNVLTYNTQSSCSLTLSPVQTWNASLRHEEPVNCPLLLTSPWRISTCGSLLPKTAVSTGFKIQFVWNWWDSEDSSVKNCKQKEHLQVLSLLLLLSRCSKCSVQPVCSVQPLRHHYGRSLHSLLSQSQLGRMVHI